MEPTSVTYQKGNAHAPVGIGAYTIELDATGGVRLVHEKHRLEPA